MTFIQPRLDNRDDGILDLLDSLPQADGSLQRVRFFFFFFFVLLCRKIEKLLLVCVFFIRVS